MVVITDICMNHVISHRKKMVKEYNKKHKIAYKPYVIYKNTLWLFDLSYKNTKVRYIPFKCFGNSLIVQGDPTILKKMGRITNKNSCI